MPTKRRIWFDCAPAGVGRANPSAARAASVSVTCLKSGMGKAAPLAGRSLILMERVTVVNHPAVADRLARLRDKTTPTPVFRRLVEEVGVFLAYEATRDIAMREERVEPPLEPATVRRFGRRPVVAPILRSGLGLLPGFLSVVDGAVVAPLGFF